MISFEFLAIMSLPKSCNPSFLRVFGDYGFTPEFTKSFLRVFGDYEFTKEFTKPAIILWRPLVNSAGAPPQGVYQTSHNIMTALGKLCGCFPCGAQAVVKDRRVYQTGHNHDFLRVFGDYEFTKKL